MADIDARIGLDRLRCLHVNDSMMPFDSQRDRHAALGKGEIGKAMSVIPGPSGRPGAAGDPGDAGHQGQGARPAGDEGAPPVSPRRGQAMVDGAQRRGGPADPAGGAALPVLAQRRARRPAREHQLDARGGGVRPARLAQPDRRRAMRGPRGGWAASSTPTARSAWSPRTSAASSATASLPPGGSRSCSATHCGRRLRRAGRRSRRGRRGSSGSTRSAAQGCRRGSGGRRRTGLRLITTGVPSAAVRCSSASAAGPTRTQPKLTLLPIELGSSVPWMAIWLPPVQPAGSRCSWCAESPSANVP